MAFGIGRQQHLGPALAKAGRPALTLKRDGVAHGRLDVAERDLAGEFGRHRPDFDRHADGVLVLASGLHPIATRDAGFEYLGVVECIPGLLLGDGELAAALHVHGGTVLI